MARNQHVPERIISKLRDGAAQGHRDTPLATMLQSVLGQLETGKVVIVFDEAEESCSMVVED